MDVRIFGIRHHGPGSAKTLRQALEEFQPDCLLLEGPQDAQEYLPHVANPQMKPPVALLLYDPKDFDRAFYFPFATFSPEWQAMRWAQQQGVELQFIDLPIGVQVNLEDEKRHPQLALPWEEEAKPQVEQWRQDPLALIAQLAGYSDSERWWEAAFEQQDKPVAVFPVILDMIRALRKELDRKERPENLLREAYMRKQIRKAVKEKYARIAVVCGAWHTPALDDWKVIPQKNDNARLKGLKKAKLQGTWIPWTYDRLSFKSGYRSGVISPAWYDLLFTRRQDAVQHWMIRAGRLLRKEQIEVAPAHVIDAVRLANTLAAMRGMSVPGLEELKEGALSTFAQGNTSLLALIEEQLIIGNRQGKVPVELAQVPLQKDLEQQIRSARLSDEYSTTDRYKKELDLRKGTNLKASILLHRLNLLGIPWGNELSLSNRDKGSFKELWSLKWDPGFIIRLIEMGMWGSTIEEATVNRLRKQALETQHLKKVTELMQAALKADLAAALPTLTDQLEALAAKTYDVLDLLEALPVLVRIIRYSDTRQTSTEAVWLLLEALLPRVSISLLNACIDIEQEAAVAIQQQIIAVSGVTSLIDSEELVQSWEQALLTLAGNPIYHPLIGGTCTRLAYERRLWTGEQVHTALSFALSKAQEVMQVAEWIDGFLFGSGLLLIHQPSLWQAIDRWVDGLDMERFTEALPVLRRAFSRFAHGERQRMLQIAKQGVEAGTNQAPEVEMEAGEVVAALLQLRKIFGYGV